MRRGAAAGSNQSKSRKPSPLRCGVYLIRHRESGKGYVGSSASMEKCWNNHRTGNGSTVYLTRAIKLHGADAFDFSVLELCARADLPKVEGKWIAALGTLVPKGYNISAFDENGGQVRHPDSRRRGGEKLRGRKFRPETLEKMAAAKRGHKMPEKTREVLQKGETVPESAPGSRRHGMTITEQLVRALEILSIAAKHRKPGRNSQA
jgi:group I intron endonuclease